MLLEFRDSTIQFVLNGIIVSMIGVRFDAIRFALTSEISGKLKNYTGNIHNCKNISIFCNY